MNLLPSLVLALQFQAPEAILTVDDASAYSNYGESVAIQGDWAFVGAPDDYLQANYTGSVYAFKRTAGNWSQHQKLVASDGGVFGNFGHALAIDGDVLVVGSPGPLGDTIGAAYVFRFDGQNWVEEQKISESTGWGDDWFGWSVDVEGDRIAIGAMWARQTSLSGPNHAGAAWTFVYDGQSWVVEQELSASDMYYSDHFGSAVGLSGGTLAVGARGEGDYTTDHDFAYIGAVYMFDLVGGTWSEVQKLRASTFEEEALFGDALDIEGDWMIGGSRGKNGGISHGSGAVYAFQRTGGVWAETQEVDPAMPGYTHQFGRSISMDGDRVVIGSGGYDLLDNHQGAIHVYRLDGTLWEAEPPINPGNLGNWDLFAQGVALDGDTVIAGAYLEDIPPPLTPGGGYIYDLTPRFHLMVRPLPLDVAEDAKFVVREATPLATTWMAYSLRGLGSTNVAQLNVVLDLRQPKQLAQPKPADASGNAQWEFTLPANAAGRTVWFQGVQQGQTTNPVMAEIH